VTNGQLVTTRNYLVYIFSEEVASVYRATGDLNQMLLVWVPVTLALLATFLRTGLSSDFTAFTNDCASY